MLTIGEVAQRAGLKASAIRYYESVGVLPEAERISGQRRYSEDVLRRLEMIDVAKRAGFSLEDTASLLAAGTEKAPASSTLRALAEQKLPEVEALIIRAQAMAGWLSTATGCDCDTLDVCKLFEPKSLPGAGREPSANPLRIERIAGAAR